MAKSRGPTELERETMHAVLAADARGEWFRSRRNGERVVLANLHRRGVLERRAWRGTEGEADAAHEYRPSTAFKEAMLDGSSRERST